jgi:hypothetical protein
MLPAQPLGSARGFIQGSVTVEDQELLAAIGKVALDAAALEYLIAVLVAATEGQTEDYARKLAASPGAARKALEKLSAARPARMDLDLLSRDASALVTDRHVLMHSVAMRDIEDSGGPGVGIWNPLKNAETRITAPQVLDHARSIRILTRKVRVMIADAAG